MQRPRGLYCELAESACVILVAIIARDVTPIDFGKRPSDAIKRVSHCVPGAVVHGEGGTQGRAIRSLTGEIQIDVLAGHP